jgi:hypothetical protein
LDLWQCQQSGSNGSYPTSGTSALAYFSIESSSTRGVLVNNYNPLTQAGIAIRNRRTPAQNTELEAFVAFLTDFTTSPSPDSPMITTLKNTAIALRKTARAMG